MKHLKFFSIASMALACLACNPNITPDDPDKGGNGGNDNLPETEVVKIKPEYSVPADGATLEIPFTAEADWSIINNESWISLSKVGGSKGDNKITVTVEKNEGLAEREADLFYLDGAKTTSFKIIQGRHDVININGDTFYVSSSDSEYVLTVGSNVDFTVSVSEDWVKYVETKAQAYKENSVVFQISGNDSPSDRSAIVTIEGADVKKEVTFIQSGAAEEMEDGDFFRAVLGLRFTGTWCGWCPSMAYDVNLFNEEEPGRLNCICVYNGSGKTLDFSKSSSLEKYYGIDGYPSIALDSRGQFSNLGQGDNLKVMKKFAQEEMESYPSGTGISVQAFLSGETISIVPTVYAKESADYKLHVVILEDGIVAKQQDYANLYTSDELKNFVHNHVIKSFVTEMNVGDECKLEAGAHRTMSYNVDIPSNVVNAENIAIAVFTTRPTVSGPKAIRGVSYYKNMAEYVDNSVICPINSVVKLRYEE